MKDFIFEWFFCFIVPFMLLWKGIKPVWQKRKPYINSARDWLKKQLLRFFKTFYSWVQKKISNKQKKETPTEAGSDFNKRTVDEGRRSNETERYDTSNNKGNNGTLSEETGIAATGSGVLGKPAKEPGNENQRYVIASDEYGGEINDCNSGRFEKMVSHTCKTSKIVEASNTVGSGDSKSNDIERCIIDTKEHVYSKMKANDGSTTDSDTSRCNLTTRGQTGSDVARNSIAESGMTISNVIESYTATRRAISGDEFLRDSESSASLDTSRGISEHNEGLDND